MTQSRIHDYRAPRATADLNKKFVELLPAGILSGFRVQPDGAVGPGVLLTNDGVRIEETVGTTVEVPPGHATMNRYDLIVCRHQYLEAWPNPPARFEVVQGTPSEDLNPPIPELPEHNILLAYGLMRPGETTWSYVFHASAPLWMRNLRQEGDGYHVVCGDQASILARYDRNDNNALKIFVVEGGTVSDGALVELTVPSLTLDGDGIRQLSEHVNDTMTAHAASAIPLTDSAERFEAGQVEAALAELAGEGRTTQTVKGNADAVIQEAGDRANAISAIQSYVDDHLNETGGAHLLSAIMAGAVTGTPFSLAAGSAQEALAAVVGGLNDRALKSGDTFSGDVTFQGKVTLDADDAEDVAFDDYVYFRRMVPPCAAPSDGGWDFCCDHGALRVGVNNRSVSIPIPNIPVTLPPKTRPFEMLVSRKSGKGFRDEKKALFGRENHSDSA